MLVDSLEAKYMLVRAVMKRIQVILFHAGYECMIETLPHRLLIPLQVRVHPRGVYVNLDNPEWVDNTGEEIHVGKVYKAKILLLLTSLNARKEREMLHRTICDRLVDSSINLRDSLGNVIGKAEKFTKTTSPYRDISTLFHWTSFKFKAQVTHDSLY